jgi:hypothetical protein
MVYKEAVDAHGTIQLCFFRQTQLTSSLPQYISKQQPNSFTWNILNILLCLSNNSASPYPKSSMKFSAAAALAMLATSAIALPQNQPSWDKVARQNQPSWDKQTRQSQPSWDKETRQNQPSWDKLETRQNQPSWDKQTRQTQPSWDKVARQNQPSWDKEARAVDIN